jgi:hypothetical protein
MKTKHLIAIAFLVTGVALLGATTQPVQREGRFQLVPMTAGTMFLVDTTSGKVWRYSLPRSDEKTLPLCRGAEECFLEVDRLRLTGKGYASEVIP